MDVHRPLSGIKAAIHVSRTQLLEVIFDTFDGKEELQAGDGVNFKSLTSKLGWKEEYRETPGTNWAVLYWKLPASTLLGERQSRPLRGAAIHTCVYLHLDVTGSMGPGWVYDAGF